jgi:Arc/MetJ-type ribon-helix-helix transcriptional regulator
MDKHKPLSVKLTDEQREWIKKVVELGFFHSEGEVVRIAISKLMVENKR